MIILNFLKAFSLNLMLAVSLNSLLTHNLHADSSSYKPGKLALVQFDSSPLFGNKPAILEAYTKIFKQSVSSGANIIVFPEGAMTGYSSSYGTEAITEPFRNRVWASSDFLEAVKHGDLVKQALTRTYKPVSLNDFQLTAESEPVEIAEEVPNGPTTRYWEQLAIKNQVYLIVPLIEKTNIDGKDHYVNAAVIIGPKGYIMTHRKSNFWIQEAFYQSELLVGNGPSLIETPYGRFFVEICNGIFNESFAKSLKSQTPHALLFPSQWVNKDFNGFQGFSHTNSYQFLANYQDIPIFSSEGQRRTGVFYPASKGNEFVIDDGYGNSMLLVDIQAQANAKIKARVSELIKIDDSGGFVNSQFLSADLLGIQTVAPTCKMLLQ